MLNRYGIALLVAIFPFVLVVLLYMFAVPTGFGGGWYGNTTTLAIALGIAWFVATDCAFLFTRTVSFQAQAVLTGPDVLERLADLMQIVANTLRIMHAGSVVLVLFCLMLGMSANQLLSGGMLLAVVLIGLVLTGSNGLIFCMGPLRLCADHGVIKLEEYVPYLFVQLIPVIGAVGAFNVRDRCRKEDHLCKM